jgi:hypothetical protein
MLPDIELCDDVVFVEVVTASLADEGREFKVSSISCGRACCAYLVTSEMSEGSVCRCVCDYKDG